MFFTYNADQLSDYCFCECSSLTTIKIPSIILSIGRNCYEGCSSLTNVISLKSIDYGAFCKCTSLKKKKLIPSSVEVFGKNIFNRCSSLEEIAIPQSADLKNIGLSSKVKVTRI